MACLSAILLATFGTPPAFGQTGTDTTAPTVTTFELDLSTVTATTARMLITFSEPVTGVDAADFAMNTTPNATATITGVTPGATAASYAVAFSYTGTAGSLQMAIKSSGTGIVDAAANAFAGRGVAATIAYPVNNAPPADMTIPSVTSFTAPSGSIISPANLTLVFNEAVTGVSADDFIVNGAATLGTVSGSGTTWTIPVTFTGTAPVSVTLVGGATANIRDTSTHWLAGGNAAASRTFTPGSVAGSAPVISSSLTASVAPGAPFTYTIVASNSPTTYTATGLPTGLTFTSPTISGSVAAAGIYNITIGATNASSSDSRTLVLTVTPPSAPVISSPLTASVAAGAPFTYTIVASNSPTTYTATGLPTGLTFTSPTISGSVAAAGIYNITIGTLNASGSDSRTLVLTVTPAGVATRVISATPPANGTYVAGQTLTFTVTFSGPVTVAPASGATDTRPYFTLAARSGADGVSSSTTSGRVTYASGSGTSTLTFTYVVQNGDAAPGGIVLGTSIQLPAGASIRGASGTALDATALTIPWPVNPLMGVILAGSSTEPGKGPVTKLKRGNGLVPGQPYTLPATNAAGQPITWVLVSGNATLSGNVLTPKNRGAVVLRAFLANGTPASATLKDYEFETEEESTSQPKSAHRDRLANLSSRLRVFANDPNRAAIAGFVVTGTGPKQVLVRAVGPGLAAFGVNGAVTSARVQLFDQSGRVIAQNNGWDGSIASAALAAVAERLGAFRLNAGSGDSALVATLAPGVYTAHVAANADGIALLEVYDASGAELSTEQLVNISTRGFVDSGEGKLIAGFVVSGDVPKRVLVRGVGAALGAFGVSGTVTDPVLELVTATGVVVARNDNWEAPQAIGLGAPPTADDVRRAAIAAGAFPLGAGSRDAAIVITLLPGNYSAVVSGANNTTGAGLVEVYELPNQ